jgi:hypothetical protein
MKPLYRKTLLRFLPIVFNLERANQLSLLPDKDLADFCPLIEPYQVTKNRKEFLPRSPRVDSFKLSTADFESINLTEDSQVYLSLTKRVSHNN